MIATTGETLKGRGVFLLAGVGSAGLAVTVDVFRNDTLIVAGAATTELDAVNAPGVYQYTLAGASVTQAGEYLFHFLDTGGTSDQVDVYAQWYVRPWLVSLTTDIASAVWNYATRTLTSFGTLVANITTAISAILCNVWNCPRRTLTMSIVLIKSMLRGQQLDLLRGDTLDLDLTGLGDLTTATELWFTVKKQLSDLDTTAEIQISLTGGLLAIAGAVATTPANGSITITDIVVGNITIALTAAEMAKLDIDFVGYWDVQKLVGVTATTLTRGNAKVLGDVTRSVT